MILSLLILSILWLIWIVVVLISHFRLTFVLLCLTFIVISHPILWSLVLLPVHSIILNGWTFSGSTVWIYLSVSSFLSLPQYISINMSGSDMFYTPEGSTSSNRAEMQTREYGETMSWLMDNRSPSRKEQARQDRINEEFPLPEEFTPGYIQLQSRVIMLKRLFNIKRIFYISSSRS